jgi:hypothetical protein
MQKRSRLRQGETLAALWQSRVRHTTYITGMRAQESEEGAQKKPPGIRGGRESGLHKYKSKKERAIATHGP